MGVVVRQSIKGTIVNYIGAAIGFVTTFFVLTKYLTAEEIGLTKVLVDASILLSGLAQLGTNTSAMRYYPYFKDEEKCDHGFFGWTLIVPIIGFIIFTLILLVFQDPLVRYFSKNSSLFVDYLYFVIPMGFFMLYLSVFETNSNLLLRIVVPRFIREIGIRLVTLAAYLLYAFGMISLNGMVIGMCIAYFLATILNIIYLFSLKRVSFKIEPGFISKWLRKDFLLYTLFLIAFSIAGNIVPVLNTFFISGKMGLVFTGIYTIAVYISSIIEMPYRSLSAISRPHIAQAMKDNNILETNSLCKNVSLHQFLVGSLIFFLIWINIDLFYSLLPNGENYVEGKWVFFALGICKLLNSTLNVGSTVLSYSKYYYYSLIFTIILTASAIILNIKLIPIWGMIGAALASLISYSVYYAFQLSLVKWKTKVSPFSWKELIVALIVIVLFVFNWLCVNLISDLLISLFSNVMFGCIVEAVLRTGILLGIGVFIVYRMRISEQVNSIIDKLLVAVKLKSHKE